ncbi:hypothetical protein NC652_007963 [Populus alba x Populus x berolinensis]|nr:hypothetical protein NC652_007963 [Populus alba x Populus x berolinensis]
MEQVHLFTKKLKPTHISRTLSVPTHVLEAFPFPEGAHMMNFEAVDASDNVWSDGAVLKYIVRRNRKLICLGEVEEDVVTAAVDHLSFIMVVLMSQEMSSQPDSSELPIKAKSKQRGQNIRNRLRKQQYKQHKKTITAKPREASKSLQFNFHENPYNLPDYCSHSTHEKRAPPIPERPGFPREEPSTFHLNLPMGGGDHITPVLKI